MNVSYHFAPIRLYNGAKSNKKCKAIAEFVKQLLDRQSYDQQEVNQQSITEAVQKECDILNKCVKSSNGKLVAYSINTNEYEDSRDWKLTVDYIKSSGEPIQLLSILCFYTKGNVREGDVRYAKECYGDTIRKSIE